MDNVISVKITSTAEASAVDEFEAKVEALGGLSPTVTVEADTEAATARLDDVKARLQVLSDKVASARADVDDEEALAKLSGLEVILSRVDRRVANPRIDIGGIARAEVELARVNQQLDGSSSKTAEASHAVQQAGGSMIGVIAALSPALVSVGVVGGGAAVAVGAGFTGAALGLGAFALAAKNDLTYAQTQASTLLSHWQDTQKAFTDPVIVNAVHLIPQALSLANPAVAMTSGALQTLEAHAKSALGSPYWKQFANFAAVEGSGAIRSFGSLLGGTGHLMAGVLEAFAPELARIDADAQRWAADLSRAGDQAANGGMTKFMEYLQQNGPRVAHTFEQLGSDVVTLARASAPLGPIWLNVATVVARLLGDLEKFDPELTTWALGAASVGYAANKMLGPLGGLSGAFGGLRTVMKDGGNFVAIANGAEKAAGPLGRVAVGLGNVAKSSGGAVTGAEEASIGIGALLSPLGLAVGVIGLVAAGAVLLGDHLGDMAKQAQQSAQTFAASFVQQAQSAGQSTSQIVALLEQQRQEILANVAAHHENAQAVLTAGDKVVALDGAIHNLTQAQEAQTATQQAVNQATGQSAGYTGNAAIAYGQLTAQLRTANTELSKTNTELAMLLDKELGVATSTDGVYAAIQNLSQSLKTNGVSMDETTAKGLANKQAFDAVASSISGVVQAMAKHGSTSDQIQAKVSSLTNYLVSQAGQYHLTGDQVQAYLRQLGLTPAQVKTDLKLSGYDTASANVAHLSGQLAAINGEHVGATVTVYEQLIAATAATRATTNRGAIPQFALGGIVPGPIGTPMLAYVHAGETIIPPEDIRSAPHGPGLPQAVTAGAKQPPQVIQVNLNNVPTDPYHVANLVAFQARVLVK